MNLNRVEIIGRVTKTPELKALPSGMMVASFSLATNRVWNDKNGQKQEETEFHNVTAFGKTAETLGKFVVKGQLLYVDGRLQTRSWEDKESKKKMYRTEIMVNSFQFGPKANGTATSKPKTQEDESQAPSDNAKYPLDDINPEDIPF